MLCCVTEIDAEKLLLDRGFDGSFLVRLSSSNVGAFTSLMRRSQEVHHIKVQNNGDFFDLFGGKKVRHFIGADTGLNGKRWSSMRE